MKNLTAADYARFVPRDRFAWTDFEAAVFKDHPTIWAAFNLTAAGDAALAKKAPRPAIPTWLVAAVLIVPQFLGFAELFSMSRFGGPDTPAYEAIEQTAVLTTVSLGMLVAVTVMTIRRRRDRRVAPGTMGGLMLVTVGFALINGVAIVVKGIDHNVVLWQLQVLPSVLVAVLGSILAITDSGISARVRLMVNNLDPAEAEALRDQVREGLELLRTRGVISNRDFRQATRLRFGHRGYLTPFSVDTKRD
jgi:hypothetical protein